MQHIANKLSCLYFIFSCSELSDEIANNTLLLQHIVDLLTYEHNTTTAGTITNDAPSAVDGESNVPATAAVGGVNYKRWGRTVCAGNATLVYAGMLILYD